MKKRLIKQNNQAGFTLVELMVSLSLFVIVVLALVSSLYNVNDASRKVQAIRTVMDNINFAMETMSRNIRTAEDIRCGGQALYRDTANCPIREPESDKNYSISMKSTLGSNRLIEYRWNTSDLSIEKKSTGYRPDGTLDSSDVIDWTRITSPEIKVERFQFYVDGAESADSVYGDDRLQPSVIIHIEGRAMGLDGTLVPFAIQTYVSQRAAE